jgi:hypothetical protein
MLDRLGERVELKQGATVVVDRGMAFDDNLADIKARKLHHIVASRQPERNQWLAEFEDTDGSSTPRGRAYATLSNSSGLHCRPTH